MLFLKNLHHVCLNVFDHLRPELLGERFGVQPQDVDQLGQPRSNGDDGDLEPGAISDSRMFVSFFSLSRSM